MSFLIPFNILAQQAPVELQAKIDAESDANKDVNKLIWFGAGCILSGLILIPLPGKNTSCFLLPLGITGSYFYRPSPPHERFIGKPPVYVDTYTSTYKSERGNIQASMSAIGCVTGCGLIGRTLFVIGLTLLDEVQQETE